MRHEVPLEIMDPLRFVCRDRAAFVMTSSRGAARVARVLRDPDTARKLRESRDAEAIYAVLEMPSASAA
jgi:hypothetical protein